MIRALISWIAAAAICGVAACGSSTSQPKDQMPLPPLAPVPGKSPEVVAKGGTLLDSSGKQLDLAQTYTNANVILVFFRGAWCLQCRKQLTELQERNAALVQEGWYLHVVSVDAPAKAAELKQKLSLSYPVLSDPNGKVARRWGVLDESTEIAKPATFMVKKGGQIIYRKVGMNPDDRPHADDLVKRAGKAD